MVFYRVLDIKEADYGCEECMSGPKALVLMQGEDGDVIGAEMTEEWLCYVGIDVGSVVVPGADGKFRPVVKVAAAVICAETKGRHSIFATCRGYGEYKGMWEFPGGKTEPGETPEQTLLREIREELDIGILVGEHVCTVEYDYPRFRLYMDCFFAEIKEGEPVLKEHSAAKWLTKENIETVDWLPADMALIGALKKRLAEMDK